MTDDTPDLTDRQREFLQLLPASTDEIADALGVSDTTVQGHRDRIRDKGVGLEYDGEANQWFISDDRAPKLRRISTKHKQSKTREANSLIEAEESLLLRRLERTEPLQAVPDSASGEEAFVPILGDLHFGDVVEDDQGRVVYDTQQARAAVRKFGQKCLEIRNLESEYTNFGECHLILLGDLATGTHIYDGQVHDVEAALSEQVTEATQALVDLVLTLADGFPSVHVHGVLGNHGLDRASAARGSNTDLICYRWLQDALRRERPPNVSVEIAESTHHLNFEIRGHSVHVRHGQDGLQHVDSTAASSRDWRGWQMKHDFDLAVRGHHHTPALDWVLNRYPVVSAPTPKPGGEYIERLGSPDDSRCKHLGWCVGVNEKRPLTFKRLIDDL